MQRSRQLGLNRRLVYVVDTPDTLHLYDAQTGRHVALPAPRQDRLTLSRKEFDVDIFTIAFKLRRVGYCSG